ncbi:MAG: cystathionine beta-lyase [Stappiaceae bacterium]
MTKKTSKTETKTATKLAHAGLNPHDNHGFVNPPVIHASTVLFPDAETMRSGKKKYKYGRRGTPTSDALTGAVTELEGASGSVLAPSGLAATSLACMSCLKAGDHLLMTDSAYEPTRHFCDVVLKSFGVQTTYYDPMIGAGISTLFEQNTRAVFTESPGSLTFEIQDIQAIADVAHKHDALVLMDNTWATPLYFRPLDHGVDLSIQAGTKYLVGHSDVMLGTIAANERAWSDLIRFHGALGIHVGPDDVYLGLRGLRTMGIRLAEHQRNALAIATWLDGRDDVGKVFHPALPGSPGHTLWKRDFKGSTGLFSFELKRSTEQQVTAFLNALEIFGLGYSWGGFESLAIWARPETSRTIEPQKWDTPLIRLHIGLEDPEDLMDDLKKAFQAASNATGS